MTPQQKFLVQESFARVAPIAERAATLFYGRLFELDPGLRPLFRGDLEEQGRKLMQMLAVAVNGLDRLEEIVPAVAALGRRHVGYGVQDGHYATVGEALMWTLQQGLGDAFCADTRQAWVEAYEFLAGTMRAAAAQAADG
ncbi:MAG: globin family protein [Pseudomonadota bacterium]